jgi:hypothetical protein
MTAVGRPSLILPILIWLAVSLPFVWHTPDGTYTHDFPAHHDYTQRLHRDHRLPLPGEGVETHQPPLYYLMALSCGAPDSPQHVRRVRCLSILFGALALALIASAMLETGCTALAAGLAASFLATTPHFVFFFTSYNNDVLAVLLGILLWSLLIRYAGRPSRRLAIAMGLVTCAGCFSKLAFGATAVSALAGAAYLRYRDRLSARAFLDFAIAQVAVAPIILAYLFLHNLGGAGRWMVLNPLVDPGQALPHSALRSILTPPGITRWEWVTPFAEPFMPIGKKNSLIAYGWVSAIFGEYPFLRVAHFCVWGIFWAQTIWLVAALREIFRDVSSRLCGLGLVVAWIALAGHVLAVPYASSMDFRHVAWVWLPLTLLRARAVEPALSRSLSTRRLIVAAIGAAILLQWTLVSAL